MFSLKCTIKNNFQIKSHHDKWLHCFDCYVYDCAVNGCTVYDCAINGCTVYNCAINGCTVYDYYFYDCAVNGWIVNSFVAFAVFC